MSLYTVMFVGMAPWGSLLAGTLAHAVGTPLTVAAGGALCMTAGLLFALRIPAMRTFVRYPIPETPLPAAGGDGSDRMAR